jgi:hypothetical protein
MQNVVLDSCVLYQAPLRDFFMRLAVKLYQPKWTEKIHEEWMRSVLEDRPDLTRSQLERTRDLMNRHGGICLPLGFSQPTTPVQFIRTILLSASMKPIQSSSFNW